MKPILRVGLTAAFCLFILVLPSLAQNERIVFTRPDGGVSVVIPAPNAKKAGESQADFIARVMTESVPVTGINAEIIDASQLPIGRVFRDAWSRTGPGAPIVDMVKARGIHAIRIASAKVRAERQLEAEEIQLRLQSDTPGADMKAVALASVRGLDLAAIATQIGAAQTPAALKAVWPVGLQDFKPF